MKMIFTKKKKLKILSFLNGKYLFESITLKNQINTDLNNYSIKYDLITNLIDEKNSFYNKIFVITDGNEKEAKKFMIK